MIIDSEVCQLKKSSISKLLVIEINFSRSFIRILAEKKIDMQLVVKNVAK